MIGQFVCIIGRQPSDQVKILNFIQGGKNMKEIKRILSLILCFVMVVGLMPAFAVNASAAGEAGDDASIGSDVIQTVTLY